MLRLLLIRHGETSWNAERRIMGAQAIGLNAHGLDQAASMAQALAPYRLDAIYSSPLLRARETAEILNRNRPSSIILDSRIEEINYGTWVGKTFSELRELPDYKPYYEHPEIPVAPEGETLYQVRDRAMEFIGELHESYADANIAIVAHADWIKCVLMQVLQISFSNIWRIRIDNASISLLEFEKRGPRIICLNQRWDLEHLWSARISF